MTEPDYVIATEVSSFDDVRLPVNGQRANQTRFRAALQDLTNRTKWLKDNTGTPTWATVLVAGNTSGGTDPILSTGDALRGEAGGGGFYADLTLDAGVAVLSTHGEGAVGSIAINAGNVTITAADDITITAGGGNTITLATGAGELSYAGDTSAHLLQPTWATGAFELRPVTPAFSGTGTTVRIAAGGGGTTNNTGGLLDLVAGAASGSGTGGAITATAGTGGTTGPGGDAVVTGGAGGATSGDAGDAFLLGGTPVDGAGGGVSLGAQNGVGTNRAGGGITGTAGNATGTATGGSVSFTAGAASGSTGTAGVLYCIAGSGGTDGTGGIASLVGGPGGSTSGDAGGVNVYGGTPVDGNGGSVSIVAPAGVGTNRSGGSITMQPGAKTGSGTVGSVAIKDSAGATKIEANATGIGVFGATPIAKPTITGSRGGNAALASLLTELANLGWITDSTSA